MIFSWDGRDRSHWADGDGLAKETRGMRMSQSVRAQTEKETRHGGWSLLHAGRPASNSAIGQGPAAVHKV